MVKSFKFIESRKIKILISLIFLVIAGCGGINSAPIEFSTNQSGSENESYRVSTVLYEDTNLPASIRFEKITASDGLSSNAIRKIYQDRTGYLWIGTQDGLNKYDGYSYKIFRHDPTIPESLRDNFIETIYEDHSGILWIGTQSGWLEKYNPRADTFTHFQIGSRILSIYEDSHESLWIGTFKPGLFVFDRDAETAKMVFAGGSFNSIVEDPEGKIWVASPDEGLLVFDPITFEYKKILTTYPVNQLLQGNDDDIWLGTNGGGLGLLDPSSEKVKYYQSNQQKKDTISSDWISTLHGDAFGRLWIGTWDKGLDVFFPETETFINFQSDPLNSNSLGNNEIVTILVDRSGVLWVGNEFGGLNKATLNSFDFGYYHHIQSNPNSMTEGIVTSMHEDQNGVLWVGTLRGLNSWNRGQNIWKNYYAEEDTELSVRSIYLDQNKQLWIGTESGLYTYNPESDQFTHYDTPVVMWMMEDSKGIFWMATKGGLYQFDPVNGEIIFVFKGISWKIMVFEDFDGNIWVGSSGDGVDVLDSETGDWHHFEHDPEDSSSISGNFIETIHQNASGEIWIGTNNGLNKFDPITGTFSHYFVPDGLPHNYVVGILEDSQGHLWVSTLGGLSEFDFQTKEFKNYYRSDGLQGDSFWRNSYHKTESGELVFGGVNGINVFNPGKIEKNPYIPPVVISSISLFNEPAILNILNGDAVELSYKENFLSFDFAAFDYTDPSQNEFAYQMEGVDSDWVEIGNRTHVDFPSLDPGEYTFRVIGSNNDGVWNEEGAWVDIVIKPPFWLTWWFRGGLITIFLISLVGAYRIRINQMAARNLELETEVEKRTVELRQEIDQRIEAEQALLESEREKAVLDERNRLARELHDAVTQTLFSASLLAEAIPKSWQEDPAEAEMLLNDLRQLSRGALAEMRTLLLELRPAVLADVEMHDLLRQLSEAVGAREDIKFHLDAEEGCKLPLDVHITFYRIAQETLNNIVKHAQCESVTIKFQMISNAEDLPLNVELGIRDDGVGFDVTTVPPKRMGLGIMQERAESIGADLSISSQEGKGTSIQLNWVCNNLEGKHNGEG